MKAMFEEITGLRKEKEEQFDLSLNLEKQLKDAQMKQQTVYKQMMENVNLIETIKSERNDAVTKEQNMWKELQDVKIVSQKQLQLMTEELRKLEGTIKEKELDYQRAIETSENGKLRDYIEELKKKMVFMETEKVNKDQKAENSHEFSKLQKKISKLEAELTVANQEKQQSTQTVTELTKNVQALHLENQNLETRYKREIENVLRTTEEIKRMYELQFEHKSKMKDENRSHQIKYEKLIQELRNENLSLLRKNEQLAAQIEQLGEREDERLHLLDNVKSLQNQFLELREQHLISTSRENDLFKENKQLLNKVDLLLLENSRISRDLDSKSTQLNQQNQNLYTLKNGKSNLEVELLQIRETHRILSEHLEKVKAERDKLRKKLKKVIDDRGGF